METNQLNLHAFAKEKLGLVSSDLTSVKFLNLLWIGIILFSTGYVFSTNIYYSAAIFQGIQLVAIISLVVALSRSISFKLDNSYFSFLLFLYLLWQVVIVARGSYSEMTYEDVKSFIFSGNYGIFCLLVPLVALVPVKLVSMKKIFDAATILCILFIVFVIFNLSTLLDGDSSNPYAREILEGGVKFLGLSAGLILLTFTYHSKPRRLLAIAVFIIILIFAAIRARRGLLMMTFMIGMVSFLIYFFQSNKKIGWVLAILYLVFFGYQLIASEYTLSKISLFSNLYERGLENTRSYVENCFYSSMTTWDWIIGKGFNSGYKCPGIDESVFKGGLRKVIETDYLQLILTGGIVNLGLLLLIVVPAIILGLFYTRNMLTRISAIWIIIWLVFLYPSNAYTMSIFHVSVWVMISVCYSRKTRNLSSEFIFSYFTKELRLNKL